MLIVYDSFTGNVQRFVKKLGMRAVKIEDGLIVKEPFVLITYTYGKGDVPESTMKFLMRGNFINMKGVASSGNRNWEPLFAMAGDKISSKFGVPLLLKFEMSGTEEDVAILKEKINQIK